MLKGERITLLIIPEAGGKTLEFKVRRYLVVVSVAVIVAAVVLLGLGLNFYLESRSLGRRVARLEREKALLEEEVEQIGQLEQVLLRLQRSNHQLRAILGESARTDGEPARAHGDVLYETYVGATDRLRWGQVRSFPGLWPVDGAVTRVFSELFPAVVIAAPLESVVRASAAGQVTRAGYGEEFGYLVTLDHGGGLTSQYGYGARLLVEEGAYVEKGQPIILSGRSGRAQAPSLYYAIRENGQPRNPVDFRLWL